MLKLSVWGAVIFLLKTLWEAVVMIATAFFKGMVEAFKGALMGLRGFKK